MDVKWLHQGWSVPKEGPHGLLFMDGSWSSRVSTPVEVNVHTAKVGVTEFEAVKLKEAVSIPILGFCETELDFPEAPMS